MIKLRKKILIFIMILSILLPYNINSSEYKVYAATTGTVITLEVVLALLLGFVAQKSEVNIPIPLDKNERHEFLTNAVKVSGLEEMALGVDKWKRISDGKTLGEYILIDGNSWNDLDLSEWTTDSKKIEMTNSDIGVLNRNVAEYFNVPVLTNKKPSGVNSPLGNLYNIKGVFIREGMQMNDSFYDSFQTDILNQYNNVIVIKRLDDSVFSKYIMGDSTSFNTIYIIGSDYPLHYNLQYIREHDFGNGIVDDLYSIGFHNKNNDININNRVRVMKVVWMRSYWSINTDAYTKDNFKYNSIYSMDNFAGRLISEKFNFKNNVIYSTYDTEFKKPENDIMPSYDYLLDGQSASNSLTYRSFLASKYGGGSLTLKNDDTLTVNIDEWILDNSHLLNIDNVGSTDNVLKGLKEIDDNARESGQQVVSNQILSVQEYIDAESLEKYNTVIATQADIHNSFMGTYEKIGNEFDVPQNILNGLTFVAYVFGTSWENMGEYSFVLVFGGTIGCIAMLIGFGVQKNKRDDINVGNKNSKSNKGG